ncbi:hypothetical protein HK104_007275 [Borealophlyctis nickersoniae]|nr:hypothetical protein HK104_007275 [Borealophlyctis nickersoniae]
MRAVKAKQAASKEAEKIADVHCSDLVLAYEKCKRQRSYFDLSIGCERIKADWEMCKKIQLRNLQKLGFTSTRRMTERQREEIIDKADELFVKEYEGILKRRAQKNGDTVNDEQQQ